MSDSRIPLSPPDGCEVTCVGQETSGGEVSATDKSIETGLVGSAPVGGHIT